jgi:hypothetical protein
VTVVFMRVRARRRRCSNRTEKEEGMRLELKNGVERGTDRRGIERRGGARDQAAKQISERAPLSLSPKAASFFPARLPPSLSHGMNA